MMCIKPDICLLQLCIANCFSLERELKLPVLETNIQKQKYKSYTEQEQIHSDPVPFCELWSALDPFVSKAAGDEYSMQPNSISLQMLKIFNDGF